MAPHLAVVASLAGCESGTAHIERVDVPARATQRSRDNARLSEVAKIRALIDRVRGSELSFVQDGKVHNAEAAAAELERRLARTPAGVVTATQFIDRIGAGLPRSKTPDLVKLPEGAVLPTRDWLLNHLADIEGAQPVASGGASPGPGTPNTRARRADEVGILDALTIIERSDLRFVAPARKRKGKRKGKRKEYTGPQFAEMLRKKWELLGKDIHDLDTFVEEIASDALLSMTPYVVAFHDGREEPFAPWLLAQLEARRKALAGSVP